MTTVKFRRTRDGKGLALPAYETPGAAGMDLRAACTMTIPPMARVRVPTGLEVEIERGFEGQIRPRSGDAYKRGLTVINSPGTIDSDYRGELCVLMVNLGTEHVEIGRGDRIAQMVISPVIQARIVETDELSETARGKSGFGSTGLL